MTKKFDILVPTVDGVAARPHEFLELVRRYDEANGTDPVPDRVNRGVRRFELAGAMEDTSSAERWKAGKLRWSARGDRGLLEKPTHLQDDIKREHTR